MDSKKMLGKIAQAALEEVYAKVADKSGFGETGAGFHKTPVKGDFQKDSGSFCGQVLCGREAVCNLAFIPKDIKNDLACQLGKEKAEIWRSFAIKWNEDHPDFPLATGDGIDPKKAEAAMRDFEKLYEDESIFDKFSNGYDDALSGHFANEDRECDIDVAGVKDGNKFRLTLSFGGMEIYSSEILKEEMRSMAENQEEINDFAAEFLADAASAARERKAAKPSRKTGVKPM